jgi:hypothetical protein
LHQSHEFDKEILAPRLKFLNRAAGGLLFCSRTRLDKLSSGAR